MPSKKPMRERKNEGRHLKREGLPAALRETSRVRLEEKERSWRIPMAESPASRGIDGDIMLLRRVHRIRRNSGKRGKRFRNSTREESRPWLARGGRLFSRLKKEEGGSHCRAVGEGSEYLGIENKGENRPHKCRCGQEGTV